MSEIRILLVDDEEDYVRTLAERMEMRDLHSRVATSGADALRMVEEETPDVMVLDLRMPGIDGMQVLERVKEDHPQVQVLILTGHGTDKEEKEARALGAFDYLHKPADTGQLIEKITAAWKRSIKIASDLLKESKEGFEETMQAAAWAEAGEPEMAARTLEHGPESGGDDEQLGAEPARPGGALRVLIVDDEEDYARTMAERMEMRDLGSGVALSGEDALRMVEAEKPDVVVLDLRMPGMGGLEALARLREAHPEIGVVILTGHGSHEDEEEARRLGAFDYLHKPVDLPRLVETIRRAGQARNPTSGSPG